MPRAEARGSLLFSLILTAKTQRTQIDREAHHHSLLGNLANIMLPLTCRSLRFCG